MRLALVRTAGWLAIVLGIVLGLYFIGILKVSGVILLSFSIFAGKVLVVTLAIMMGVFFVEEGKSIATDWEKKVALKKHKKEEAAAPDAIMQAAQQEVETIANERD